MRTVASVDAATAAKYLGIGRNTLLQLLRNAGYTHAHSAAKNLPKKQFVEAGLFATELVQFQKGNFFKLHEKLKITAAGMRVCRDLLDKKIDNHIMGVTND